MRFQENGPDIPDDLIFARNNGQVVFFCGAGVSVPAKMPSFLALTKDVMVRLGVSSYSSASLGLHKTAVDLACSDACPPGYKLPFSLDQTFYLLQQEYGADIVEKEVLRSLKLTSGVFVENHKTILRLARNAHKEPQVVTTNFDLIFEKTGIKVRTHISPNLPDLGSGQALDGVVYLHGRWHDTSPSALSSRSLIISSADFGRAYLADGWASRFIKQLTDKYVIVLLGYSAEDPPVRYLLEGLHAKNGSGTPRIYAFDRGTQEAVDQNWRHRGVTGIAFPEFENLWSSLEAWASFSENITKWTDSTLDLARTSPRNLQPFERRQVAFLVSTAEGAKAFSECDPPLSTEWICVFDAEIRNAKPQERWSIVDAGMREYAPQTFYALDNDLLWTKEVENINDLGVNFIRELSTDDSRGISPGLSQPRRQMASLSPRLLYLSDWLGKSMHDPITLWWCVRKTALSPLLLNILKRRLSLVTPEFPDDLKRLWYLFLERDELSNDRRDFAFYEFKSIVKSAGWGAYSLRELERSITPRLTLITRDISPPVSPDSRDLQSLIEIELLLPKMEKSGFEVPEPYLADAVGIFRRAIEKAAVLVKELSYYLPPDIQSDAYNFDGSHDDYNFLQSYLRLIGELAKADRHAAAREVSGWITERYFFDPLRLRIWLTLDLCSADEVGSGIIHLSEACFWSARYQIRELIRRYWENFSQTLRNAILMRIVDAPLSEDELDNKQWNQLYKVAPLLIWLDKQGCALNMEAQDLLAKIRSSADLESDDDDLRRKGFARIERDTSAEALLGIPLSEITSVSQELSGHDFRSRIDHQPFEGLIEKKILLAFRVLVLEMKRSNYPASLWRAFLNSQQDIPKLRLLNAIVNRVLLLPDTFIEEILYSLSSWMLRHIPVFKQADYDASLHVWDMMMAKIVRAVEAPENSLVERDESTQTQRQSKKTRDYAINAPIGKMIEALLDTYRPISATLGSGIPRAITDRVERLLSNDGECRYLVLNSCGIRLDFLSYLDSNWTKAHLLPAFDLDEEGSEAAWNGLLHSGRQFRPEIFSELKRDFVGLFNRVHIWRWDNQLWRALHEHLVLAAFSGLKKKEYLQFSEIREILQRTNDQGRANALHYLSSVGKWNTFQKKFIAKAWPRELRLRSDLTSHAFLRLAFLAEDSFPDAVSAILPFIFPMERTGSMLDFYASGESVLAKKYPDTMLTLLDRVIGDDSIPPYQFHSTLNQIVEGKDELRTDIRMLRLRRLANRHIF